MEKRISVLFFRIYIIGIIDTETLVIEQEDKIIKREQYRRREGENELCWIHYFEEFLIRIG